PGPGREKDHQAVEAGQAELRVVEEAGADLDGEAVEAGDVGGLDVDLAMGVGNGHGQDRRHDDAAFGQGGEGAGDDVDCREVEADDGAQIGLGKHGDVTRHGDVPSPDSRR